jgi:hypothetical protein
MQQLEIKTITINDSYTAVAAVYYTVYCAYTRINNRVTVHNAIIRHARLLNLTTRK